MTQSSWQSSPPPSFDRICQTAHEYASRQRPLIMHDRALGGRLQAKNYPHCGHQRVVSLRRRELPVGGQLSAREEEDLAGLDLVGLA